MSARDLPAEGHQAARRTLIARFCQLLEAPLSLGC
jgi:hypothetical protein